MHEEEDDQKENKNSVNEYFDVIEELRENQEELRVMSETLNSLN